MTPMEKLREEISENGTGSRPEFQASIKRFTAMMLDRLAAALTEKDRDEKEIKMLSAMLTKAYKFWDNALRPAKHHGKEGGDDARQIQK